MDELNTLNEINFTNLKLNILKTKMRKDLSPFSFSIIN